MLSAQEISKQLGVVFSIPKLLKKDLPSDSDECEWVIAIEKISSRSSRGKRRRGEFFRPLLWVWAVARRVAASLSVVSVGLGVAVVEAMACVNPEIRD